jgi:hypothetical protein
VGGLLGLELSEFDTEGVKRGPAAHWQAEFGHLPRMNSIRCLTGEQKGEQDPAASGI